MEHTYNSIEEAMHQHERILRELRALRRSITRFDRIMGTATYKRMVILNCHHIEMKGILYDFALGLFPLNLQKDLNQILT